MDDYVSNKDKLEEIIQEVRIMVKIGNHPNVVRIIGTSINNSDFFIITNYCENGSLLSKLSNYRDSMSDNNLIKISEEIASGLSFLHSNGIIHRDIATRNVLIDSDGA